MRPPSRNYKEYPPKHSNKPPSLTSATKPLSLRTMAGLSQRNPIPITPSSDIDANLEFLSFCAVATISDASITKEVLTANLEAHCANEAAWDV